MDWRQAEILDLISMYRESECLWNCLSSEYKDVDMKKNAWKEIADHFDRDIEEVKKKIKHLRTNYVVEKKKVTIKNRPGSSDPAYEPRLFYYDEMTFLDPVVVFRASTIFEQQQQLQKQSDDPLSVKRHKRSMNGTGRPSIVEKRRRKDSTDDEMDIQRMEPEPTRSHYETNDIHTASPQIEYEKPTELSKEETFCAMICSELKLIKSEDIYDNVTLEIFQILKNAKMAERQIEYQPEEDSKPIRRT